MLLQLISQGHHLTVTEVLSGVAIPLVSLVTQTSFLKIVHTFCLFFTYLAVYEA